jgi:hypothetical protein
MSTACKDFILNHLSINNSISLAIVLGLHEMYNSLKLFSFFSFSIRSITFLCNHSLGGSTITSQIFCNSFCISGLLFNTFSDADAINLHLSLIQFISAL